MLKHLAALTAAACLTLAGTGCIDSTTTVSVNPDGSGEIIQELTMSAQTIAMMQGFGGGAGGGPALPSIYDEAKFKAMVPDFGAGVTFKSGKELVKADGSKGAHVVFAFTDVTKINISPDFGADKGPAANAKMPVTFGFKKDGKNSVLSIKMPPRPENAGAPAGVAPPEDPQAMAMMGMMKPMLEGMRVRMLVKVNGEIKSSTASYVTADDGDKKKVVTLMDFEIGKMISDPAKFKRLSAIQGIKDPAEAMELLKDLPEIKMELKDEINVHFK